MTKDDFPVQRKRGGCQDGGVGGQRRGGDGNGGGGVHAPTEREPSTAIFLFFKMSPVIGESGREGGEVGRGEVGGGED